VRQTDHNAVAVFNQVEVCHRLRGLLCYARFERTAVGHLLWPLTGLRTLEHHEKNRPDQKSAGDAEGDQPLRQKRQLHRFFTSSSIPHRIIAKLATERPVSTLTSMDRSETADSSGTNT